jgi:hypothetical protein
MREIYQVTENLRNSIRRNGITNKITFGDILEVDLDKTTIYPLAHLSLGTSVFRDKIMIVTVNALFIDILDITKTFTDDDTFYGNDNLQDVLNTQFTAVNILQSSLRRGALYELDNRVTGDVILEPFFDNFENQLAGWSASFDIEIPNTELAAEFANQDRVCD